MSDSSQIREHMEVIGADGVHVGTVDRVHGDHIKLTKKDSGEGSHRGHHHTIPLALVVEVEGDEGAGEISVHRSRRSPAPGRPHSR